VFRSPRALHSSHHQSSPWRKAPSSKTSLSAEVFSRPARASRTHVDTSCIASTVLARAPFSATLPRPASRSNLDVQQQSCASFLPAVRDVVLAPPSHATLQTANARMVAQSSVGFDGVNIRLSDHARNLTGMVRSTTVANSRPAQRGYHRNRFGCRRAFTYTTIATFACPAFPSKSPPNLSVNPRGTQPS